MSLQQESNNSLIKNGVDIRVPNNIYNCFVSTYRSDLLIGASTINKVQIRDGSIGGKATTINFTSVLTPQLLYSNQVVLQSDVNFMFSNVRVKQDRTAVYTAARFMSANTNIPLAPNYCYLADSEATQTAAMGAISASDIERIPGISIGNKYVEGVTDNYTVRGLSSNPFQVEFAPCTNFLNAYLAQTSSVCLATNGNPVTIQTTPKYLDIHSRGLDEDDVYNNWSGSLIPSKSIIRGQRYYAFPKTYGQIATNGGVVAALDEGKKYGTTQAFKTVYPTYFDIEKDPNMATNSSNRGKLDRALTVNWKFEKTAASFNYTVSPGATGDRIIKIEQLPQMTKELNNVVINGYTFPSSFSSSTYTDEELYSILGDILFFTCDQLNPLPTGKDFGSNEKVMIFVSNEPTNQSMTVEKQYVKMQMPLYNPLLSSGKSTACFSNTSMFNTTLTRNQNIRQCIEYIGAVPISTNTNNNNVSMDISVKNCQLELTQYSVSAMESAVKNTSRLYFNNYSIAREANSMVKVPVGMKEKYMPVTMELSQIHIGSDIPRAVMFYLSSGVGSEDELYGYKIVKITAKISSGMGGDATGDRDMHEIFRTTREVQLSDYKIEDITGYTVPYKTFTNVNGYGSGSVVVFDSSDFGFSSQILSIGGLSGKSFTITYVLHIEAPTVNRVGTEFNIQAHVYHITSSYIELNNSQATIMNQLFDNSDAITAIEEFKNASKSGSMHMSNRRYLGGNVFSKLLKLRHIIPKVYNTIPKVLSGVTNAVNTGRNVLNTMDNVTNAISKTGFFGRH